MIAHDLFVLLNYISVILMIFCTVVIATHKTSRMQQLALLVSVCLTICCVGFLFRAEAADADSFLLGQKLIYAFVTHGMFLMLLFIFDYCRYTIPVVVRWLFHSLNFVVSFVVLTLDYHTLFYKDYWAVQKNDYIMLSKEYGFMHTVAVALFGLYMAAAVVTAIVFSIQNMRKRSKYVWRILIAVMLPCVAYIVPKITGLNNDLQPMAFAAFTLLVLYMIYKNSLYDIDNIATQYSVASVDEALVVIDNHYQYKGCNRHAEKLFPVLKSINLDADIRDDADLFLDFLNDNVQEYRAEGSLYSVTVCPIREGNMMRGNVVKFKDITLQRQYTDLLQASKESLESEVVTLSNYSFRDELTGLRNRRSFEDSVSVIRNAGSVANVVVGSADLNGLKTTNDTIGHAAGDEQIKAAAALLHRVFSKYGKVFRTGGDEFIILLSEAPAHLDELTATLEADVAAWHGELAPSLSISYGFVHGSDNPEMTIDRLLIEADKAMYRYKNNYYTTSGHDRRGNPQE